jgi:hypothetical protein
MQTIITLLTDFGTRDSYVAEMKGILYGLCPQAALVDVTHEVPPQDVRTGARFLRRAVQSFPPKTIHLAVIDPGVGSSRRPLAIEVGGSYLVGPDNGLLLEAASSLPGEAHAYVLDKPAFWREVVSPVFHGRDLFAPVAGHLARGLSVEQLGTAIDDPLWLPRPHLVTGTQEIEGEVVSADRFGNLITSIPVQALPRDLSSVRVQVAGLEMTGIRRFYAEANPGEFLALVGSDGEVEIALREGSAAAFLKIAAGARARALW